VGKFLGKQGDDEYKHKKKDGKKPEKKTEVRV